MHRIASYSRKVMLRFRRWSRKEYAAFMSLHRHVTIGQVGRGIADASLGKQKATVRTGAKSAVTSWTSVVEEEWPLGGGTTGWEGALAGIGVPERQGQSCRQRDEVPASFCTTMRFETSIPKGVYSFATQSDRRSRNGYTPSFL